MLTLMLSSGTANAALDVDGQLARFFCLLEKLERNSAN